MSEGAEVFVYSGTVDERGEVKPDCVNETRGRLSRWKGRRVTVSVRRYVKPKSNPQLALYFGPVLEAWSEYTGYDPDEMDMELRRAYLAPQLAVSRLTGEEVQERPRMRDLSAEEMSAYLERVLREGRQLGIVFVMDGGS